MIDSPKQSNPQIIDSDSIIFTKTIELSQKEDSHKYKDFKLLNLLYINSQHSDLLDFAKFDKQQDQVNLIIYFDGSHLTSIPKNIDELIVLLNSKSPDFNRENQIRIFMRQYRLSKVDISINILKQILVLIKKILLNEPSESKLENETALLGLLEFRLDLKEKESGSSPTISSYNSSPSLEIPGDGLLEKHIDGNTSFEPPTPMKKNREQLFNFNYELRERVTFNSQSYDIYNSPNNREITKISRLSNDKNLIKDCVKNSIKIAIGEFVGFNIESGNSNLLKSYEYLLIAIHSGGVKHEKIKYKQHLDFLYGNSKRLNYKEAKELSKIFQSICADEFKIYTGRISNNHDAKLVGMRTKRIPLELLIETANEELGADEFEKFLEVDEKLKKSIVTDFSKKGQQQEANSSISSPNNKGSLTSKQSFMKKSKILYSTRKKGKRIFSYLDNEDSLEKINLFLQSDSLIQKKESQYLFDTKRISPRKIPRQTPKKTSSQRKKQTNELITIMQKKVDSRVCIKMMKRSYVFKKLTSRKSPSKSDNPSIQYSRRADAQTPKTIFSTRPMKNEGPPFKRLKGYSVTADSDELQNRSQKRFPIIDFSCRADTKNHR